MLRRYLHAYGPATARDFAQWFDLPPRAAGEVFTALAGELVEVDVEGDRGFLRAADLPAIGPAAPRLSSCCRISTATASAATPARASSPPR